MNTYPEYSFSVIFEYVFGVQIYSILNMSDRNIPYTAGEFTELTASPTETNTYAFRGRFARVVNRIITTGALNAKL